ncbi:MAG TPA: hypothetical protein VMZ71_02640 [Gemmataceae bacterium]|nr:hypothetical protein [Gemmataceae bacterium]
MRELATAVRGRAVVVFVGAGVSMNLGTPSWRQLIGEGLRQLLESL